MNGNFEVKKVTENTSYEYKNSEIIVLGTYSKNGTTKKLESIHGDCYRKGQDDSQGEFFGSFNGIVRSNDEVRYSMSEMSRRDANKIWDAIDEVEPEVLGENSEEE